MAIPQRNGLRKIKVGNKEYYWNFNTNYPTKTIRISIGEINNQNKRLLIDAYYVDTWLTIGDKERRRNEIEIVTPGFIRQAIDFAISNGWNLDVNKKLYCIYENKEFVLSTNTYVKHDADV